MDSNIQFQRFSNSIVLLEFTYIAQISIFSWICRHLQLALVQSLCGWTATLVSHLVPIYTIPALTSPGHDVSLQLFSYHDLQGLTEDTDH